jgi:hypothetical protein
VRRRRGALARRQQQGLERWRDGEATRGRGENRGGWMAARSGALRRRQGRQQAEQESSGAKRKKGEE